MNLPLLKKHANVSSTYKREQNSQTFSCSMLSCQPGLSVAQSMVVSIVFWQAQSIFSFSR
jgi:hypothetical protein